MNSFSRTRLSLTQLEDQTTPAFFTVNSFTDAAIAGKLNLREAIAAANAAVVTADNLTNVRNNREGVLSAPIVGMYMDAASNPNIAAANYAGNGII